MPTNTNSRFNSRQDLLCLGNSTPTSLLDLKSPYTRLPVIRPSQSGHQELALARILERFRFYRY